jgi:hypothetical protein
MSEEPYFCDTCHRRLRPDDQVDLAAQLVEVTPDGDSTPQYIEGIQAFFHPRHVPTGWRVMGQRGTLRSFRPTAK